MVYFENLRLEVNLEHFTKPLIIYPNLAVTYDFCFCGKIYVEMPGIEPGAFHMQSERSTTELHPHRSVQVSTHQTV